MSKPLGGTKTVEIQRSNVPIPIENLERTREVPAVHEEEPPLADTPLAAPEQIVPTEKTVPVKSCIESSLLHEILRRESAEEDK